MGCSAGPQPPRAQHQALLGATMRARPLAPRRLARLRVHGPGARLRIVGERIMNRKLIGVAIAIALGLAPPAHAQIEANLGALTAENAKGYLDPLRDALSGTMNAAIFQSGNVPKQGFGVQFGVKLMGVT